jgi:hypothetical protein
MTPRRSFLTLAAAAAAFSQASATAGSNEIFHVPMFRFCEAGTQASIASSRQVLEPFAQT